MVKIVFNADDLGKNHENNLAVMESLSHGWCDRASLIMNMWGTEEAVQMCRGRNDVAFHLNLVRGKPLTERIRRTFLCDRDGNLRIPSAQEFIAQGLQVELIEIIREECEAQMVLFRRAGFESARMDSHGWSHAEFPVALALRPLMRKYGFKTVRTMNGGRLRKFAADEKLITYYKMVHSLWQDSGAITDSWSGVSQEFIDEIKAGDLSGEVEIYVHPRMIEGKVSDFFFSHDGAVVEMSMVKSQVMQSIKSKGET